VFGAVFLSLVVMWLGARVIDVELPSAGWLATGALIFLGIIGVVLTLLPHTRQSGARTPEGGPKAIP
jgi:predicted tellurium resistance membrane protein TerC